MVSPSTQKTIALLAFVIFCAGPIALSFYAKHRRSVDAIPVGTKISPFVLTLPGGKTFTLGSPNTKKLILIFFSTACEHCRKEMNNFDSIYKQYSTILDVIGVCVDNAMDATRARREQPPSFPVAVENGIALAQKFKIGAVPTVYYIDDSTVLRGQSNGEHSYRADSERVAVFLGR
ncbi:MAG TPA: TlpA disulfide reductase family protein [Bacteroidota bacterium]|nr:TlpA disulfide reductase family protein [Bacteroidota bacterium]